MENFTFKVDEIVFPDITEDKTFGYNEISNSDVKGSQKKIYLWNPEMKSPLKGKGVQEMQRKMLYVLRYYAPYTFMELFPTIKDAQEVSKGVYGPRTTRMVMQFQSVFMYDEFKAKNFNVSAGFGCFGPMTKAKLEELYKKMGIEIKRGGKSTSGDGSETYADYVLDKYRKL